MTTIAQQLKAECKSAADVMERADQMRAEADQDWDNETTTGNVTGAEPAGGASGGRSS